MTATIKIDPSRLPKPLLEPTRSHHSKPPRPTPADLLRAREDMERTSGIKRDCTGGHGWSEEEKDILVAMRAQGKSMSEIAAKIGRTKQACFHMQTKLRKEREQDE